ncbi:MAG TPA: DUF4369 domain-containing protein [Bacteroidales bacterium]|nr:DUF4369 domain-containing protein [Bacteroidales bacterium]
MRKQLLFSLICIIAITACSRNKTLIIEGNINNPAFNGSKVFIVGPDVVNEKYEDSAVIRNNKFRFAIQADTMAIRTIRVQPLSNAACEDVIFIKEAGTIKVFMSDRSHSSGTRLNDLIMTWKKLNLDYDSTQNYLSYAAGTPGMDSFSIDSITKLSGNVDSVYLTKITAMLDQNLDNGFGMFLFRFYYDQLSVDTRKSILQKTGGSYISKDMTIWRKVMFDPAIPKENGQIKLGN